MFKHIKNIKNFYIALFSTVFIFYICEFSLGVVNYIKYKNEEKIRAHEWKEILTTQNIKKGEEIKINYESHFPDIFKNLKNTKKTKKNKKLS